MASSYIPRTYKKGAVLLNLEDYKTAAIYSIYKHTIEILNSLISMFLVVFWSSGGLFIINYLFRNFSFYFFITNIGCTAPHRSSCNMIIKNSNY